MSYKKKTTGLHLTTDKFAIKNNFLSCNQNLLFLQELGCPTCFPLLCSQTYQIKNLTHKATFSHLEQSLGNIGCSH